MTNPAIQLSQTSIERLQELGDYQGQIYTSSLSVNEFLLVKQAGFHPLGMVLGSSIYNVGVQFGRWSQNQELTSLSQAMYHARELAMSRMIAEARALNADGIVGVRLEIAHREFVSNALEFIATGTAVRAEGDTAQYPWKLTDGNPFTSDLSGQEFWTLLQTGHAPIAFVLGSCVYHLAHRKLSSTLNSYKNAEIPEFTQGLYEAREHAMQRMQHEAKRFNAEGIVGVRLQSHNHAWGGHTIEFLSIGTAIRPYKADHLIKEPTLVLGLD